MVVAENTVFSKRDKMNFNRGMIYKVKGNVRKNNKG